MIGTPLALASATPVERAPPAGHPNLSGIVIANPNDAIVWVNLASAAGLVLDRIPVLPNGGIEVSLELRGTVHVAASTSIAGSGDPAEAVAVTLRWRRD